MTVNPSEEVATRDDGVDHKRGRVVLDMLQINLFGAMADRPKANDIRTAKVIARKTHLLITTKLEERLALEVSVPTTKLFSL